MRKIAALGLAVIVLLAGCGGSNSSNSANASAVGKASITIKWPARSRVIPEASNSILIELKNSIRDFKSSAIARPSNGGTVTWTSPAIPPGDYTLTANAYPNADGTGTIQAGGTSPITIVPGQDTTATVTMGSTVSSLSLTPAGPYAGVAATQVLTATPKDSSGNIVLVAADTVHWTSSDTTIATIGATGTTSSVTGVADGTVTITATFTEVEPLIGQTSVTATTSFVVEGGVLTTSGWPKYMAVLTNSSRSTGSGSSLGTVFWNTSLGGTVDGSPVTGVGGVIFEPTTSGLNSISSSGGLNWTFAKPSVAGVAAAAAADGSAYYGSSDTNLYMIASDGTQKWAYKTGGVVLSPTIGPDSTVYVVSGDGVLYAINPNGTLKWSYATGVSVSSPGNTCPAIDSNGIVYFAWSGKVYAITQVGAKNWIFSPATATTGDLAPSIGPDGSIYYSAGDGNLYKLSSGTGVATWSFAASGLSSPAIGADGSAYMSIGGGVIAVSSGGTHLWTYSSGSGSFTSAPAIAGDGSIYANAGGSLVNLSSGGALLHAAPGNVPVANSSPAIGSDGTVYIGSSGQLVALK